MRMMNVVVVGLGLAWLVGLAGPAEAITCPGSPDAYYGLCVCTGFGGPIPYCPRSSIGDCTCQNPDNIIGCLGPGADYCPEVSVCTCDGGSAPCLGHFVGGPAAGLACYLMPEGNTGMTAEQKAAVRDLAFAYGALGTGLGFCTHPACTAGSQVLGVGALLLDLIARHDPPDENYLQTAAVVPASFTPLARTCRGGQGGHENVHRCAVTTAEANVADALLTNLALGAGIEEAVVTTTNRLSTAIAENNMDGITLQIGWLNTLKAEWAVQLRGVGPLRDALAQVLDQRSPGLGDAWVNPDASAAELALANQVSQ